MSLDPDKYLGQDVFEYSQEKERFVKDLYQFHAGRGTQFLNLPTVSGHAVDLYLLYSLVTKNGGFHKVCDKNLWWKVSPELFPFPPACVNAELGLKEIYMRYLYLYERVYVHGEDPDHPDDEDLGPRGAKTSRILVHQVPMIYNYRQHRVRGSDRAHFGLSTDTVKPNEYERLEKSLLSGLPNEVDFAFNVCCLLSMEGPNTIKLLRHPRLIDLLLAHIALFSESSTLQPLYHQEWYPKTKRNFTKFWYETVDLEDVDYGTTLLDMISCPEHKLQDQNFYLCKNNYTVGSELLYLGRDKDGKDGVFHRIQQICNIIRNVSFDSLNAKVLSESSLVFNFALLCCHSTLPEVKHNGMDILINISKMYVIPAVHESSAQLIIKSLHRWIHSQDKLEMVSALLILAALSQVEENEEAIIEALPKDVYCRIVSLARIYDLQLIVASLDALYYLSEIGESTCEAISLVKHCIDFLINLVTVETQSFGESALGGIIVRDHRMAPPPHLSQPGSHPPRPVGTAMGPPATPFNSRHMSPRPQMTPGQSPLPTVNRPHTPPSAQMVSRAPTPPYRLGQPRPGLSAPHRTILPATPQNLATMSPDQVASNWLRANYEPYPGAMVFTAKIHQEYVLWLQRRAGPAATPVQSVIFVSCVKKVFPYSEVVISGSESQISGVRWKPPQTMQPGAPCNQVPAQLRPSSSPQPPAYNSKHMVATGGSSVNGMPPRIASPSHLASHDMLRSILLSDSPTVSRQRSHSGTSSTFSSGKSPRAPRGSKRGGSRGSGCVSPRARSSGDSPLPPISPSMELQVCGSAEKVESFVNGASLARIERVENPQSPAVLSSLATAQPNRVQEQETPGATKPANTDLSDNPDNKQNNDIPVQGADLKQTTNKKSASEEDNDSAMDTSEQGPPSHDSIKTNGCLENGPTTPSDTLSSPPVCNGNTSDTDSLLTEPTKHHRQKLVNGIDSKPDKGGMKINGSGDNLQKSIPPLPSKNGFINGLEKMLANISEDKSKSSLKQHLSDHRRHHSGDSLASQSSTSTQLSISQNSISSDTRLELPDQTPNHLPLQTTLSNQPPQTLPKPLSSQPTASSYQQPAQTSTTNQQTAQPSTANHIPTVVESISKPIIIQPVNNIGAASSSSPVPSKSPLASPSASSKKGGSKRRRSTASTDSRQSLAEPPGQYKCLWECCGAGFMTCSLLRRHVSSTHTTTARPCLWAGCDRTERKRWALVSHVNERHTSDSVLAKALANREKGILPAQPAAASQTQPVYTPQAARVAILRNFPKPPFPDFLDSREGPVTKHIRFTASLILRNLCRYSPTGRTLLKKHESKLAAVAGSGMEASAAIINCLYEIQQTQHL